MEKASGVDSVRRDIAIIAGPRDWDTTREKWLDNVPRRVRSLTGAELSYRTVKSLWYGEIKDPDHRAARNIKRAAGIIEMRKATSDFADQLKNLIGDGRADNSKNFSSTEIDLIRRFARSISSEDST